MKRISLWACLCVGALVIPATASAEPVPQPPSDVEPVTFSGSCVFQQGMNLYPDEPLTTNMVPPRSQRDFFFIGTARCTGTFGDEELTNDLVKVEIVDPGGSNHDPSGEDMTQHSCQESTFFLNAPGVLKYKGMQLDFRLFINRPPPSTTANTLLQGQNGGEARGTIGALRDPGGNLAKRCARSTDQPPGARNQDRDLVGVRHIPLMGDFAGTLSG